MNDMLCASLRRAFYFSISVPFVARCWRTRSSLLLAFFTFHYFAPGIARYRRARSKFFICERANATLFLFSLYFAPVSVSIRARRTNRLSGHWKREGTRHGSTPPVTTSIFIHRQHYIASPEPEKDISAERKTKKKKSTSGPKSGAA